MRINWNVSDAVQKLNPQLFGVGAVSPAQPKRSGRRKSQAKDADQTRGAGRVVCSLVGFRRILLDDDNFIGACKHLRDAIANSLGLDDGDQRIKFQYQQIQTSGEEGVLVRIDCYDPQRKI